MTALLCVGIWIGPALIATAVVLLEMYTNLPTHKLIANWAFNVATSSDIVSLPLFILMGELLFRTRLSQSLFSGIAPWMSFLPGRLFHTTVIGWLYGFSGGTAAVVATARQHHRQRDCVGVPCRRCMGGQSRGGVKAESRSV